MRHNTCVGHLAAATAYAIFGFNIIVCKDLANSALISPWGLFTIRAIGATVAFFLLSLFLPKENVPVRDLWAILIASVLGLYITQMSFLVAITMTTPLDTSIITATTPIFTMIVAAIALKEPITGKKTGGVFLSFFGVILLILNSVHIGNSTVTQSRPLGIVLMVINCFCFASYLGIFRPLISRYSVVTFMKWMFFFSMILSLPFTFNELIHIRYETLPVSCRWELGYLIVCSTLIAYFLIPIGQKHVRPTVVSMYSYLQPLIASVVSICIGMDVVSWQKIVATAAVIAGVVLVNKSRAKAD